MKTQIEREFIRCGRRRIWMISDDVVALRPREYYAGISRLGYAKSLIFDVIDMEARRVSGEIALRVGESDSLFYLGHIGYHIDRPYRGKHEALHACRLCVPVLMGIGMRSFVVTTDEDNLPSIRTCERLGCVLETVVDVPPWCQQEFAISRRKRRYVFEISEK